ncbi:MAG: PhzF family phenazine biosynthesis protein [Candidatus Moraniibacteriota bacterium]
MKLPVYQIDAFTSNVFEGNPAAIVPLEEWITSKLMQKIAMENNLSETAFIVKSGQDYEIRWFTPLCEVDLCGHATLAAAYLVLYLLEPKKDEVTFSSKSGDLNVKKENRMLAINLPSKKNKKIDIPEILSEALGKKPLEVYESDDLMAIFENEEDIKNLQPDFLKLKEIDTRGIIVTAPGAHVDIVSRFFAPAIGINEDPVTGSAHTKLTPFWSAKTGKKELSAKQLSNRPGKLICRNNEDYVQLLGNARIYLTGEITTK